jgi:hypothetical protein
MNTASFATLQIGALGNLLEGTDLDVELYEDDGSGNVTQTPITELMALGTGTKYLKVSGGTLSGYANSYSVRVSVVSPTNLGEPSSPITSETGTFGADGLKLFRFELTADMPTDDSQTLFVWSDAALTILDDSLAPIHTASTNGDGPSGAGFSSTSLTTGTYYVRINGTDGNDWQLMTGTLASTMEVEPNNLAGEEQDLGALAAGTPLHVFGSVNDTSDLVDMFTFTVPDIGGDGSPQTVTIQHFQFGEDIADIDIYLLDDTGGSLGPFGWGWVTPQFATEDLAPGVYTLDVEHYQHAESGDYMVHAYLE